ncbi:MAG: hypothetical protein AB7K24_02200 [Gemmataceae bacterium]
MKLADADRKKLPALLDQLAGAVEDLLLTGLTTASDATRQTLQVAFQEASRMRLLRLSSTLRVANEELGRFTRNQADFSRRRLCFFLGRAWLLSRGLAKALGEKDEEASDRLLWLPASQPVERIDVVTLGVAKKVSAGAFAAFEFRLRVVAAAGQLEQGQRLTWSCVFPLKPGQEVPAEAFLHLPQKQKFKSSIFLDRKVLTIEKAAVALDGSGNGRISLLEESTVAAGDAVADWQALLGWDVAAARERIGQQRPGPLDLEVELQEEIVLEGWSIDKPAERADEQQLVYPIVQGETAFEARVSSSAEGKAARKRLDELVKKKKRPPLFALMHYERCRLVLQPLTVFGKEGPEYLPLSDEAIDKKALLQTMKFT